MFCLLFAVVLLTCFAVLAEDQGDPGTRGPKDWRTPLFHYSTYWKRSTFNFVQSKLLFPQCLCRCAWMQCVSDSRYCLIHGSFAASAVIRCIELCFNLAKVQEFPSSWVLGLSCGSTNLRPDFSCSMHFHPILFIVPHSQDSATLTIELNLGGFISLRRFGMNWKEALCLEIQP